MVEPTRILIVDDEKQNIKILAGFLRADYKIMAAKNGEVALRALEKGYLPDLILLDIMMPGMSGYEFIKRIKSDDSTRHIPVIFITSLNATDDESLGFEVGAVDYIVKPFKPVIVKARVKNHIQLKQKTDQLDRLASLDGLTQVPNRRYFDEFLEIEIRRLSRRSSFLSLLLLDIDHFKAFNDNYGHTAGDDCLKKVARALNDVAKRAGDFFARYGGEEFTVILPETGPAGAMHKAKQIKNIMEKLKIPHGFSTAAPFVSVSVGIATMSSDQKTNSIELIRRADQALYKAKENGRNTIAAHHKESER